ncbi:MAG TPA: hypothetical protein VIH24_06140 [Candidatus Limnocylindria bacterium]|jgi:hypothetical protein
MVPRSGIARTAATAAIGALLVGCQLGPRADGSARTTPSPSAPPESASSTVGESPSDSASPEASQGGTPAADPAVIGLTATGCPGGVVLEWTPSTHHNFHHYTALRSPENEIATDYPPIAPAVDWGETYATDPFVTSAVDASILPSSREWSYRVVAYDILGDVVSASPVRMATIGERLDLGEPVVEASGEGATRIAWSSFSGDPTCFSAYRVLFGVGRPPGTVLTEVSSPTVTSIETVALHPGTTYQLRIDAVRVTTLGSIVAARSETVFYTVP